jgi:hypothetical protein
MMDVNEINQFHGKTISRYEWNRIYEHLSGRFAVYQKIENGIMHTVLNQTAKIDENGHSRPFNGYVKISFWVKWDDLYKRKLLLLKTKKTTAKC